MALRRAFLILVLLLTGVAQAALPGSAGHYQLTVMTDPPVIPVGAAELVLTVTADGKPVEGATLTTFTQMPGMKMGERPETARPVPGKPGVYRARAAFPMGGAYTITVTISGPHGTSETVLDVATGQDTGRSGLPTWVPLAAAGVILGLVVAWRMRATGQRLDPRPLVNRQVLGGLLLIAAMLLVSWYAVRHFRRPGSMTPLEAQVMEMNMPAPVGSTPVELVEVERTALEDVVRYSGQAVAYDEQVVTARTTGVVEWMPLYVGDSVRRGQDVARLDVTSLDPRLAASQAQERMAAQGRSVAEGELREKRAEVEGAQAESRAARASAEAAQSRIRDAQGMVEAARADQQYRSELLARSKELEAEGAISEEELQRDRAEAADGEARLRTAMARLAEARAELREAEAEIAARQARVSAALAAYDTGSRRIAEAEAGHEAARSQSAIAIAERGYADVSANLDGVVTERLVSPGTLVQAGQPLLRVAQVNPIRLQANVAEADLADLQPGSAVRVRDPRGRTVQGRITAVRPAVDPGSRQGMVEAVVANPDHRFLPGSYVAMEIVARGAAVALVVPSKAVLTAAAPSEGTVATDTRTWVWVARGEAPNYTVHRAPVSTGPSDGERTSITSGLQAGDLVVATGYANLKDGDPVVDPSRKPPAAAVDDGVQSATIRVSSEGFTPASLDLQPGVPARLTFLRVDENNCGTEVFFPELGIQKALPLNQPVVVEFTPKEGQTLNYACGMNMLKGKVLAR